MRSTLACANIAMLLCEPSLACRCGTNVMVLVGLFPLCHEMVRNFHFQKKKVYALLFFFTLRLTVPVDLIKLLRLVYFLLVWRSMK